MQGSPRRERYYLTYSNSKTIDMQSSPGDLCTLASAGIIVYLLDICYAEFARERYPLTYGKGPAPEKILKR